MVSIIVLFALCWGPTLIDNVLIAFSHVDRLHYGHLKYIRMAFALMSYFNSCVNPIVYAFMSKNFRQSFKNALCPCSRKSKAWQNGVASDFSTRTRIHWKTQYPSRCADSCSMQTSTRFLNDHSHDLDGRSSSTYAMMDSERMESGIDENLESKQLQDLMNMGLRSKASNL